MGLFFRHRLVHRCSIVDTISNMIHNSMLFFAQLDKRRAELLDFDFKHRRRVLRGKNFKFTFFFYRVLLKCKYSEIIFRLTIVWAGKKKILRVIIFLHMMDHFTTVSDAPGRKLMICNKFKSLTTVKSNIMSIILSTRSFRWDFMFSFEEDKSL